MQRQNYPKEQLAPTLENINVQSHFSVHGTPCTCGLPSVQYFPCINMLAVAHGEGFVPRHLVPPELGTAQWRKQYPRDSIVTVPTLAEVKACATPTDRTLRVPFTAPPMRGRPKTKRKRSAMELVARRVRLNHGR